MTLARNLLGPFRRLPVSVDTVRDRLWNDHVDASTYAGTDEKYRAAIMDQYKLYVEMTDRIGARRGATNTFFLLVNTGIFTALGTLNRDLSQRATPMLIVAFVVLLIQCGAWFYILRSYQQLSSAKFRVIGGLEERLPAGPWFRAEWHAIGAGRDKALYWPITRIEQAVPLVFALAYLAMLVILLTIQPAQ
ncbi:RipA family octameric membrane protein [Nocardia takedensis]|uniref:RipA family octameric membrane protein n=1 Tax=Nocardia takedensis TaxID=259390 RepID=UPI003F758E00